MFTATVITAVRRETWGATDLTMPAAPAVDAVPRLPLNRRVAWFNRYDMRVFEGPLPREWWIYLGAFAGVAIVWQLIQRTWTVHGAMHIVALAFGTWFVWFLVRQCNKVEREQMIALLVKGNEQVSKNAR